MKTQAEEWREIARTFREIAAAFDRLAKDTNDYKQAFGGPSGPVIHSGGITWLDYNYNETGNYWTKKT
jgi:hypothetical protein